METLVEELVSHHVVCFRFKVINPQVETALEAVLQSRSEACAEANVPAETGDPLAMMVLKNASCRS